MPHPAQFPALPDTPVHFQWSADVLQAHRIILSTYDRASTLLRQEEADPLRLRVHTDQILQNMVPILDALVPEVGDHIWIEKCAETLGALAVDLERAAAIADGM